jgi:hypothetical protein
MAEKKKPKTRKVKTQREQDNSSVAKYKHFEELKSCLLSGWSATAVRNYLIERYNQDEKDVPHIRAIQRWKDKHIVTEQMVIPERIINQMLKGADYKVDVLGHLSRLVAICEDRLARGLKVEMDDFQGMPMPGNDRVMELYLQAIEKYVRIGQDLGVVKRPDPTPLIDARTQNLNITPEIAERLKETILLMKQDWMEIEG